VPVSKYLSCGTVLSYLLSDVWFNFTIPWLSSTTQYKKRKKMLSRSCRCPSSLVERHNTSVTIIKMRVVFIRTQTFRKWDLFLASLHRSKPAQTSGDGGVFLAS